MFIENLKNNILDLYNNNFSTNNSINDYRKNLIENRKKLKSKALEKYLNSIDYFKKATSNYKDESTTRSNESLDTDFLNNNIEASKNSNIDRDSKDSSISVSESDIKQDSKPKDDDKIHIDVSKDVTIHVYPEHEKRSETPKYKALKHKLVRHHDLGCFICGIKNSEICELKEKDTRYEDFHLEVHHFFVEWSLQNAIDVRKFNDHTRHYMKNWHHLNQLDLAHHERLELINNDRNIHDSFYDHEKDMTLEEIQNYIDHGLLNMMLLCSVHHRLSGHSIHHTTFDYWISQLSLENQYIGIDTNDQYLDLSKSKDLHDISTIEDLHDVFDESKKSF